MFSNIEDDLIENHTRIKFDKAVKLTDVLEKEYRDKKRVMNANFTVIASESNVTLYVGTFSFGSYEYKNLYHQVKDKASRIRVDKKHRADKEYLLEKIEEMTPSELKREENIDKTFINLEKTNISKLKKWQRVVMYSLAGVMTFAFAVITPAHIIQKAKYESVLNDGRKELEESENTLKQYENALLGKEDELIKFLLEKKELNENQEVILVKHYVDEGEYDKAVKTFDGDASRVETMLLTDDSYSDKERIKKIKDFNDAFPTNEARYDLAYFDKDYELMLNLPDVEMTKKRSMMKTYALIKLGKIDDAKTELNNNNDEEMKAKIEEYEVLKAEIETLKDALKTEKKAYKSKKGKKKKKAKKEINKLEKSLKEKEKQFKGI